MIDKINTVLGIGKFHKLLIFSLFNCSYLTCFISLSFSYLTKQPQFLCRENEEQNFEKCDFKEEKFCSTETDSFEYIKDKSHSLDNWSYNFDLYCSNKKYIVLIGSGFFIGAIIGCIIITPMPDKYGRKIVLKIFLLLLLNPFEWPHAI